MFDKVLGLFRVSFRFFFAIHPILGTALHFITDLQRFKAFCRMFSFDFISFRQLIGGYAMITVNGCLGCLFSQGKCCSLSQRDGKARSALYKFAIKCLAIKHFALKLGSSDCCLKQLVNFPHLSCILQNFFTLHGCVSFCVPPRFVCEHFSFFVILYLVQFIYCCWKHCNYFTGNSPIIFHLLHFHSWALFDG